MAARHPYVTGASHLSQTIIQFRKTLPKTVNAETLKKLGIARNNESYVLNVLRFLEFIDQDGANTDLATKVFNLHKDEEFYKAFEAVVENQYHALFELHKDGTWTLDRNALVAFFRTADETTASVGKRQARTFELLRAFSGHGEIPESVGIVSPKTTPPKKTNAKSGKTDPILDANSINKKSSEIRDFGLTVRIEINLPADGDQVTYDRIFRSIKENLLDA